MKEKIEKTIEEMIEEKKRKSRTMRVLALSICYTLIALLYSWISGDLVILYAAQFYCIFMVCMSILFLFQFFRYEGFRKTARGAFISFLIYLLLFTVIFFTVANEEKKRNIEHLSIKEKIETIIKEK